MTEPIRRHPILIAQAMITLSHLTKRASILGIGAGERMNIDPYGLDSSEPVARLEEALQIIRLCLSAQGPITFCGCLAPTSALQGLTVQMIVDPRECSRYPRRDADAVIKLMAPSWIEGFDLLLRRDDLYLIASGNTAAQAGSVRARGSAHARQTITSTDRHRRCSGLGGM